MAGFYNPFQKSPDIGSGMQDMFAKIMQMMMMRKMFGQQQQQQPQMPPQNMPQYPTGAGGFSLGQNQPNAMTMGGQSGMGQMNPMIMRYLMEQRQKGGQSQSGGGQGQFNPQMLMQLLPLLGGLV